MEEDGGRDSIDEGEGGGRGVADGASQGHAREADGTIGLSPGVAAQVLRPKRKCSNKTLDPDHFDSAAESSEDDEVMHRRKPEATKARMLAKKPSAKPKPPTTPLGEESLWRPFREHLIRTTVGTYSVLAESATIDEKVERADWPTN